MQDEVRDKSVALAIKVGKTGGRLTADLLKWAIRKYLAQSQNPKIHHGKQSVKQLVGQGTGVKSIDITAKNIKSGGGRGQRASPPLGCSDGGGR